MSQDSSVGVVARLWTWHLRSCGFISGRSKRFLFFLKCPYQDLILVTQDWWINICIKRSS